MDTDKHVEDIGNRIKALGSVCWIYMTNKYTFCL